MAKELYQKPSVKWSSKSALAFPCIHAFTGYSYREEFVADAVLRCISHGLDKIDLSHPNCNPFAYLTQTAYNVFRQRIKNEKKFMKVKQRLREDFYNDFEDMEVLEKTKDNPNYEDEE